MNPCSNDQLLLRINHEIRTAVNATLGMTELLLESALTRQQSSRVNEIRRSTDHLLAQTSAILDLARAETGSLKLQMRRFFPREILLQTVELLSILAGHCGIMLQARLSEDLPEALIGDPARITEILITIVRAAMDRMAGGEITIHVAVSTPPHKSEDLQIDLTVTAEGSYIAPKIGPEETLPEEVEDPYGVSMTLARRLASLMHGSLTIQEAASPETPLRFSVALCFQNQPDQAHLQPHSRSLLRSDSRPLKILVAEDSIHNQLLIRTFVKDEPWEIETAANGRIALEKASVEFYNLILMDLDMPEMDGYNATRQIRIAECAGDVLGVPIVALTAHNETEAYVKSYEAGCTAHVTKPFSKAGLIETIRRYALG